MTGPEQHAPVTVTCECGQVVEHAQWCRAVPKLVMPKGGPEQHAATIATLYWRLKRDPDEGTAAAAIKVHAQACGLIAFLLDLHPDEVARAVKEDDPVHG